MAHSTLKGADAFVAQRRLVLRAGAYIAIFLMATINVGMMGSSWSNTEFMRQDGSFTGAFDTASSVATMAVSGLLATAAVLDRRAQAGGRAAPKACERLGRSSVERVVACGMAAWWLGMALMVSNVAYVFREEIRRCIARTLPRSHVPAGIGAATAATACTVMRGCVALNWMLCAAWAARAWRAFTRANAHFDSAIFREPAESMLDLRIIPPAINPATFSPRRPESSLRDPQLDDERSASCLCADCPMSSLRQHSRQVMQAQQYQPPASAMCCRQPTVGVATLVTEPVAVTPHALRPSYVSVLGVQRGALEAVDPGQLKHAS
ncbi:hypothetical protein H4R26_000227 [Coemansia thaxteri]|uniref:Uncharacterized protein n=1 Tax=Coemansia thaxteri TaxID=2663907 RepID=A0A9W8BP02_9FUNG|nr:hypothetical protein H4R26_000227 [Coemansia thaxteri]KAJ2487615.1 hypothetical protein EV174_000443 [Coemansia sp. RSA 2320]